MRHPFLMAWVVLTAALLGGCIEQVVDLRVPVDVDEEPIDGNCGMRERINPETELCEPCDYVDGHPQSICPCGFQYLSLPFPWCEAEDAYYECLPCSGGIDRCTAFSATTSGYGFGTSSNCEQLLACCNELALDVGSTPCCETDLHLRCAPDGGPSETVVATVSCEPSPCCLGVLCPNGNADCQVWQSCIDGRCDPPCTPGTYACCESCGCTCEPTGNPP